MSDRPLQMSMPGLEDALRDLGKSIAIPPTPDLATTVADRLRTETVTTPDGRAVPARRLPVARSLPRSLLLAAALALLAAGVVLGVRFGVQLLEIEFDPVASPTVPVSPDAGPAATLGSGVSEAAGSQLGLGQSMSLAAASASAAFPVLVPAALGPPDTVYLGGPRLRGQIALAYDARPDLPADGLLDGLGLLITQAAGRFDQTLALKRISGPGSATQVDVDGAPGYWLTGESHAFWYLAPDGSTIDDSQRRIGDTLAWERNGVLYRIEGAPSMARALEIARSIHAP